MSTFVTRRAAFGLAATAALASLTACASDIRPLSNQSTPGHPALLQGRAEVQRLRITRHLRSGDQLEEGGESAQAYSSCKDEGQDDRGHVRRHRILGSIFQLPDTLR